MNILAKLREMSYEQQQVLLDEAEKLNSTGYVDWESPLRKLTKETLQKDDVLQMTMVSFQIYRLFALRLNKEKD